MTYPRLGSWVLLRELSRDALGTVHRAGQESDGAIGDLGLLRQLAGGDVAALGAAIQARRDLAARLRSPFLGELRDGGVADGVAFLAYEYRPGVSAARMLALANDRMSPLAPELAAVVADRAAQALLALGGASPGGALLVPELLWVSTEGEVRLLGVEGGAALRAAAAPVPALAAYLSPEGRAGGKAGEPDDVWALGALLTELLTGKKPPADPDEEGAWIGDLALADDEGPLPEQLAELIGRSMVPRARRLAKVEAWQKALARAVELQGWRATPFQLAVFMHSLCKQEMARESKDVERERDEALRPAPVAVAAPVATPARVEEPAPPPVAAPVLPAFAIDDEEPPASGGGGKWIAAAAIGAVLLGGGAWLALRGRGAETAAATTSPTPAADATALPMPAATAASSTELEARLAAMMAEREKSLSEHYDQEMKAIRDQLAESRRAEAAQAAAPPRRQEPARPEPARPEPAAPAPAAAAPSTVAEPPAPAAAQPAPPPAAPAPTQAAAPAAAAEVPVVAPRLLQFRPPEYPLVARRQRVEGTVVLSLRVDANGRVAEVRFLRRIAQDVGINEAAESAARQARFAPATRGGAPVEAWYTLTIPFQL